MRERKIPCRFTLRKTTFLKEKEFAPAPKERVRWYRSKVTATIAA
jgi:hypothetical protein